MKIDKGGEKLVRVIKEKGWEMYNGNKAENKKEKFMFTAGKGNTVIDYIMGNVKTK